MIEEKKKDPFEHYYEGEENYYFGNLIGMNKKGYVAPSIAEIMEERLTAGRSANISKNQRIWSYNTPSCDGLFFIPPSEMDDKLEWGDLVIQLDSPGLSGDEIVYKSKSPDSKERWMQDKYCFEEGGLHVSRTYTREVRNNCSPYEFVISVKEQKKFRGIQKTKKDLLDNRIARILARHPDEVPEELAKDKNLLKEYVSCVFHYTNIHKNLSSDKNIAIEYDMYLGGNGIYSQYYESPVLRPWSLGALVGKETSFGNYNSNALLFNDKFCLASYTLWPIVKKD